LLHPEPFEYKVIFKQDSKSLNQPPFIQLVMGTEAELKAALEKDSAAI
jgi:hypothetical protein